MYINRIILKDVHGFNIDITLRDQWTDKPLTSVLFTGPNGSGKTTLLRVIAGLWENLGAWLRLRRALKLDDLAESNLFRDAGLAALEVHGLQDFPICLFLAASQAHYDLLREQIPDAYTQFVGEIRGKQGRPQFEPKSNEWMTALNDQKDRLESGVDDAQALPNLTFLEAEGRTILRVRGKQTNHPESLYDWLVRYQSNERWEGHIEAMMRNYKLRDPDEFKRVMGEINHLLGVDKQITDFDDALRLRVRANNSQQTHFIEDLSSGERQALILYFMIARWSAQGGVVLIDEPDLHLHVSLQRQIVHDLEQIVHNRKGQIIVSSHSPTLWEEFSASQRFELGQDQHVQL